MSRPPAPAVHASRVLLLAAAALALAACAGDDARECPGEAVATLVFSGPLTAREALAPGLDPDPSAPDCDPAQIPYPAALAPFTATISTDPAAETAALCPATDRSQALFGTLRAGRLEVATATEGAVLGPPCPITCVAVTALSVRGTVSGTGPALRFDGAVVERLATRPGADCGACLLPCAARYATAGVPPAAP